MNLKEEQLERTQEIIADDNFVYMGDSFFIMNVVNAIKAGYRLNRLDGEAEEAKEAEKQGDVLDKIRAEIENIDLLAEYTRGDVKRMALAIIDKYRK